MPDISLATANLIFNIANATLIIGALLAFCGTLTAIWAGDIRDRYADVRLSRNEAITAQANERAAVAEQKAAEANLELERLRTPRTLNSDQKKFITQNLSKYIGTQFDIGTISDHEAFETAKSIEQALTEAGWIEEDWSGGGALVQKRPNMPQWGIVAVPSIVIQIHTKHLDKLGPPAYALQAALREAGVKVAKTEGVGITLPEDSKEVIHVLVGKKM